METLLNIKSTYLRARKALLTKVIMLIVRRSSEKQTLGFYRPKEYH